MKFNIIKCIELKNWFIILEPTNSNKNSLANDANIAKYLDIPIKDYQEVLIKYEAQPYKDYNNEYYFQAKHLAMQCINELDKYLVMQKLIGE